jgi:hypothetical protein
VPFDRRRETPARGSAASGMDEARSDELALQGIDTEEINATSQDLRQAAVGRSEFCPCAAASRTHTSRPGPCPQRPRRWSLPGFRVVHAGTAIDRMYKRPCPGGYTGVRGAGVQYERRGADDATRATDK